MPENGDSKRPEPPSPDQYERLKKDAELLRNSKQSGRSDEANRRQSLNRGMQSYVRYTGIGIQFLMIMLLPTGLGYWLDDLLGISPVLVIVGAVLGSVGAMVWVVKTVFRMESKASADKR
ncbi:MAG: AtpZ/AtpI family protein [Planctomycetes bacterium]|nr:AtpZ/AtpI family protein [Planctomycetota bacterium]